MNPRPPDPQSGALPSCATPRSLVARPHLGIGRELSRCGWMRRKRCRDGWAPPSTNADHGDGTKLALLALNDQAFRKHLGFIVVPGPAEPDRDRAPNGLGIPGRHTDVELVLSRRLQGWPFIRP